MSTIVDLYDLTGQSIIVRAETGPKRIALFNPDAKLGEVLKWAWRTNRGDCPGPVLIELAAAKEHTDKE